MWGVKGVGGVGVGCGDSKNIFIILGHLDIQNENLNYFLWW